MMAGGGSLYGTTTGTMRVLGGAVIMGNTFMGGDAGNDG
jgi:hypothetical protein